MSRRIYSALLAMLTSLVFARLAFASSPLQAGGPSLLDNQAMVVAIVVGIVLALVIGGGIVIALIAAGGTRYLSRNMPPADTLNAFNNQETALLEAERKGERKPITISPTLEPFVIAFGGFLVVFILASIFVTPPPSKGEAEGGTPTPAAASGLPVTNDAAGAAKEVASLPKGNPDAGVKLFTSMGCSGCHGTQKDQRIVGPSFYGLWGRAATRKPGYGAPQYIYESIVNPNAFVVEGFQSGIMPQTFAKQLKPQDIADIIAFIQRDHNEK